MGIGSIHAVISAMTFNEDRATVLPLWILPSQVHIHNPSFDVSMITSVSFHNTGDCALRKLAQANGNSLSKVSLLAFRMTRGSIERATEMESGKSESSIEADEIEDDRSCAWKRPRVSAVITWLESSRILIMTHDMKSE